MRYALLAGVHVRVWVRVATNWNLACLLLFATLPDALNVTAMFVEWISTWERPFTNDPFGLPLTWRLVVEDWLISFPGRVWAGFFGVAFAAGVLTAGRTGTCSLRDSLHRARLRWKTTVACVTAILVLHETIEVIAREANVPGWLTLLALRVLYVAVFVTFAVIAEQNGGVRKSLAASAFVALRHWPTAITLGIVLFVLNVVAWQVFDSIVTDSVAVGTIEDDIVGQHEIALVVLATMTMLAVSMLFEVWSITMYRWAEEMDVRRSRFLGTRRKREGAVIRPADSTGRDQ